MESVYDEFVELVVAKTKSFKVGDPTDLKNFMGPMVHKAALNKVKRYISTGKKTGTLLTGGNLIDTKTGGFFVEPTIFGDIAPGSPLDQEEIFGPILALIKAKTYEEGIDIANATEYGLTGAVWTEDRLRIEKAKQDFFVGNLYINRKCTGALVDVHPFGGYNMSGTCSKAGGRDYLQLMMQAKSITEKIDY
jgi:1-pyrroline-5-carboxylate dehydrogenase